MFSHPIRNADQAVGEKRNVESQLSRSVVDGFFRWRQKIDQQRRKSSSVQSVCNQPIPRTVAAAAAPVSKHDNAPAIGRHLKIALNSLFSDR